MDKEEILRRSQLENKKSGGDERERGINSISLVVAYAGIMVIVMILMIANRFIANYIGVDNIINPNVLGLFAWAGLTIYTVTIYWYTRKILYLFTGVAGIILTMMEAYQVFRIFADAVSGV